MVKKLCIRECSAAPKALSEFYKHPGMRDGHLGICKECHKREMRALRDNNIERYRAYDRERWYSDPKRKRLATDSSRTHRARYPEKYKARNALNNAVRDGRIEKLPCSRCGDPNSQGHHHDYSKPLDVTWLCVNCHFALHKEESRGKMEHVAEPIERVLEWLRVKTPEAAE